MSEAEFDDKRFEPLFAGVGQCLHAWTFVEVAMSHLFVEVNDIPREAITPLRSAFDCVQSFEIRLAMLTASIDSDKRLEGAFQEKWATMHNHISRKAKKRAEVAHFICSLHPEKGPVLISFPTVTMDLRLSEQAPLPPLLTIANIVDRRDSFMRAERRIRRFTVYVAQVRDRLPEGQQPKPDPLGWLEPPVDPTPKGS